MIKYQLSKIKTENSEEISCILAFLPLSKDSYLEIEFVSIGAGIRRISYIDKDNNIEKLLTLSYKDIFESCCNPSLAGLTIGPNAGRLEANKNITLVDDHKQLTVCLPANEDGVKQIHGGSHKLSDQNWHFEGASNLDDGSLEVRFSNAQEDGLDGWPGNRKYRVQYRISDNGTLTIHFEAASDKDTYINMTNHTYWLRDNLNLKINSNSYIKNRDDFLPEEIVSINDASYYQVTTDDILNNAFLSEDCSEPIASLDYNDIPLKINLSSDTPALVVYTGDYLDNTVALCNNTSSAPACAIALEPQELYPFTSTRLTTPTNNFERTIVYTFSV